MSGPMRIFVSAMPGAGNLGDDLISALLVRSLAARFPGCRVTLLHFGHDHPFAYPDGCEVEAIRPPRVFEGAASLRRARTLRERVRGADLVVVGGGGLLQDSHHPWTVHHWMGHALDARARVWGLGLGAGPIRLRRSRLVLRRALPRFEVVQVRDPGSAALVTELGGRAEMAPDIVDGGDVAPFGFAPAPDPGVLGVSLRAWGALGPEACARLVDRAAAEAGAARVRLFAFEHFLPGNAVERDFIAAAAALLRARGRPAETYTYREAPHGEFVEAFRSVGAAVAMRLHANVLWQKVEVPVMPVSYSPKVAALYGGAGVVGVADAAAGDVPVAFLRTAPRPAYALPAGGAATPPVSAAARAGDALWAAAAAAGSAAFSLRLRLARGGG